MLICDGCKTGIGTNVSLAQVTEEHKFTIREPMGGKVLDLCECCRKELGEILTLVSEGTANYQRHEETKAVESWLAHRRAAMRKSPGLISTKTRKKK